MTLHTVAIIWLAIVFAFVLYILVKNTDRDFWNGIGWAVVIIALVIVTDWAIITVFY